MGGEGGYNFSLVGVGSSVGGREVVNGLRAWVQYAVVVRAYNSHGAGPLSQPVVVRTLEDVPSAPPVGVECSGGRWWVFSGSEVGAAVPRPPQRPPAGLPTHPHPTR
ncbi:cell adhesion molecule Dscam2-like [Scylla paramamosain]|uniref:cell adhesion molecule Dscam2-like n=1 Tax=Scylla paramamosain TaxID=85552 RepID=UPI003082CEB2